jgi:hypothetical protein
MVAIRTGHSGFVIWGIHRSYCYDKETTVTGTTPSRLQFAPKDDDDTAITYMRIFSRLVWLFMFALFSLLAAWTALQAWRAATSKSWPTTIGTVIAFYGTPDYRYSVAGSSHVSSLVSCNELFNGGLWVDNSAKYAVKYPLNSTVTVRYHPSRPTIAVLDTKFDPTVWIAVLALVAMAGVSAAGFIFGWRLRSRRHFLGPGK